MSDDLGGEIARLRELSRQRLKDRWRDLYKTAPPAAFTPDLIARGIAWRLQEKALGGRSEEVRRLLQTGKLCAKRKTPSLLRQGTRLVRRWRGRTYVVEIREQGFSYQDEQYGSLSEIARTITGSRWSGPRFFGLAQ